MDFGAQAVKASLVQKQDAEDLGYDEEILALHARMAVLEVQLKIVVADG
jgi:hypothetical protein